jgi:hypothetical protein
MTSLTSASDTAFQDEQQLSKEEKRKLKDRRRYKKIMADEESRLKYKKKARCLHLQRYYGITLNQFEELLEKQDNCCAICGVNEDSAPRKRLSVDHCHDTGKIRGLLCDRCNLALGMLGDGVN